MPLYWYKITLEEVLEPKRTSKIIGELRDRGWIHPETECRKSIYDNSFLTICCTPELLGKVITYLIDEVGWCIIEQDVSKVKKRRSYYEQCLIPF